jgi:hypothetical protein
MISIGRHPAEFHEPEFLERWNHIIPPPLPECAPGPAIPKKLISPYQSNILAVF